MILGFFAAADAGAAGTPAHKAHRPRSADQDETAPDITATIPAAKPASSANENSEALPPPFHLPNASRARMHECGLKWEALKMSGEAGDSTWREFGTQCLAATSEPDGHAVR